MNLDESRAKIGEFPVLFEDPDVIAVSKPEGLATIPERSRGGDALVLLLQSSIGSKLYVVHRLDKDASGVVLFAKNAPAHKCVNDQFARREVTKTYLALTHGILGTRRGTIDKPIRTFGSGRMGVDAQRGKPSSTSYRIVRRVGEYTLLEAHASTGRRHQIRVHFYSLGHPVVGDQQYGDRMVQRRFPRLMLHASAVSLRLPSGERVEVECPEPLSFTAVLDAVARSPRAFNRGGPAAGKKKEARSK